MAASEGPAYTILAADLKSGTVREEIPFDTFTYSRALNAAGAFSGTIGVRHPKATRGNLDPSRTLLYVLRDGVCVWSGIHWISDADSGSQNQLVVSGEGFFSYFNGAGGRTSQGRFLKTDKVYTNADPLHIAHDVITWAQAQTGGNIGVVVGSETCSQLVSRTYLASERHNIGAILTDLSTAATYGFDFSFDTDFSSGSAVTKMHLWYPSKGQTAIKTDLVFDLEANIASIQHSIDGTSQANDVDFVGQGIGAIASVSDTGALTAYPLLETVQQATSAGTVASTPLEAQATSYLAAVDNPIETLPGLTLRVRADAEPGDWTVGDWARVIAHDGYIDFDGYFRIIGDSISVDEQGSEQVQISFQQAAS